MFGRNGKKSEPIPSNDVFPSIDFDAIRKKLRLEVRGLENGKAGYPNADATGFDPVEQDIIAAVEDLRSRGLGEAAEHGRVYRERIASGDTVGPGIRQIVNETTSNYLAEVKIWDTQLNAALDDLDRSEVDLAQFKQENKLNREAYETGGLLKWMALCSVIIVLESMLNGILFSGVSTMGLIGGASIALIVSVVNVGLSSVSGHLYRYKNHVKFFWRLIGWISILLGAALAAFFNLLIGHFRDFAEIASLDDVGSLNDAAGKAFERLFAGDVLMQSLDAWLLTGLGLLIAAFAGWKAYASLDPYPRYSGISNTFNTKRDEWQDQREEMFEALKETRDEATDKLNDEYGKVRESFRNIAAAHQGIAALQSRRRIFLQECNTVANRLLAVYRDANRRARAAPEPAYWQDSFGFPVPEEIPLPSPPGPEGMERLADIVEEAVEKIHRACEEAMTSFPDARGGRRWAADLAEAEILGAAGRVTGCGSVR